MNFIISKIKRRIFKKGVLIMKIILLASLLIFISSASYGAVSDDIYVRKDVFEVYLQKLDGIIEELRLQRQEINNLNKAVAVLYERVDGIDTRIGDLRNDIYLGLVILGIIVALPSIQKFLQARNSSITLNQIEELINTKLSEKSH